MAKGAGKKKRSLTVAGRLLEVAMARKAVRLGIKEYTWAQLERESGTSHTSITRAAQSNDPQQPKYETVVKWARALEVALDLEFEDKFYNAFGYASPRQQASVEPYVVQLEQQEE